jgi:16S rRNA A1518/A1519 N6-dimethyltransferase RsmA/KsgA/DIM1 with predicted DNA glycosylase/AP lyase activity
MIDLTNFNWGWMGDNSETYHVMSDGTHKQMSEFHRESITQEIFVDKCYEKFFEVEEGDVVLDIGASVGPFTYSILHKKPKHVFCFEPSESEFKTLVKNTIGHPVTQINKGVSNVNSVVMNDHLFGGEDQMESITFKKFIDLYGIEKIDLLMRTLIG